MPITQVLRFSVAALFSLLGLIGLGIMFTAEIGTAQSFENYFQWAIGSGLVFLAIGAALTALDKEDDIATRFDDEQSKK